MFDYGEIPDDDFVMTTWHANESLQETFWFSERCAMHPSLKLERTYVVHIAPERPSAPPKRKPTSGLQYTRSCGLLAWALRQSGEGPDALFPIAKSDLRWRSVGHEMVVSPVIAAVASAAA